MKTLKRSLAWMLALCMVLSISGPVLAAEDSISSAANLDLTNGSIVITQANGITIFKQGDTEIRTTAGAGIIRQSNNGTATENTISVESGTVSLTISGVNIASTDGAPIDVKPDAALTLNLVSENVVSASKPGVYVHEGAELIIKGTGSLNATGGRGAAGIGGYYDDNGEITIIGGIVTTTSTDLGAGIGGGGDYGKITINGGIVKATGGEWGAGIGGCSGNDGGEITITGGTVTAIGGNRGAGVGGGFEGDGGTITITGGMVSATAGGTITTTGSSAAGIGSGSSASGGNVVISNAEVTAKGYYNAIGGGRAENLYGCDSVVIEDSATVDLSYTYSKGSDVQEKIILNTPVLNSVAHTGNEVILYADAYGASGLTYQWQVSADNSTWEDVEGQTDATATIPMSAENDGYYYRCKLTNGWGNVVYTNAAQAHVLAFDKQPTSIDAELNDMVAFEVTPSCQNVTYQWQRSYDDGATWHNVEGETYSTLIVSATLAESDAKYRCVITAANGDQLASDTVEVNLDLGDTVTYAVEVYQQTTDGTGYALVNHEVFVGIVGEHVSAPAQSFDGFYENTELSQSSGVVLQDNGLVLSRYFDRETYTIEFKTNGGTTVKTIEALYGTPVTAPAMPTRYGYTFGGWYADEDLTEAYRFDTMPLGGATIYAKWEPLGADRGMEYTINRMGMYNMDAHEEYKSIPKAQFLLEAEVRNECSTEVDAIMLVQYSADGQMLDLEYLYSNTGIGETALFGAMIDNRDGHIGCIKAFVVPTVGNMVPLANTLGIGEIPDVTNVLGCAVTPTNGTANVKASANIQLFFDDSIIPSNGQALTTSWVRSNVVLRENTTTVATVDYSASISSNGKVLTIDPVAPLKTGTEYLLAVNANAFKGQNNGLLNEKIEVLFTTEAPEIAISTITVSGATGSSDYIYYDEFVYDNGVFEGELWDVIEPSTSLSSDYGRLKIKVNTDDSDATVYIESDEDYTYGGDNETLYIEISEDEYDADCVVLYITVEDSDGYETEYELTVWLEY